MALTPAALLLTLLVQTSHVSTGHHLHPTFCLHQVSLDVGRASLCSPTAVSPRRKAEIERQLARALELYPEFAREVGLRTPHDQPPLRIYLLPVAVLNDDRIFTTHVAGRAVGRYTRGAHHIYVTPEMFTREGATDFAHEVGHYGNDLAGIAEDELDERLATQFEDFMASWSEE